MSLRIHIQAERPDQPEVVALLADLDRVPMALYGHCRCTLRAAFGGCADNGRSAFCGQRL